jgi:hypothetical protein
MITISSAATVGLVNPAKLPSQLREGEQISLTIKIEDYGDAKSITIDTSLISSDNKPIYDFGALNPSITENRYNQTITIDTSLLQQKEFQVSISGQAPVGETGNIVPGTDVVIRKFSGSNKKYYEVRADRTSVNVNSFELIINIEDDFVKTMDKVTWKELDGTKKEVTKLFHSGVTSEAQNIANEMVKISVPGSLSLFGLVKIESSFWLSIVVVIAALVAFCLGFIFGRKGDDQ